jgi:putative DNA primase/helicase
MAWAVKSESRERINAALDLAQSVDRIAVTGDDWDADKWLLGVGDGVVDLRTGEFREGRREDSLTLSTNVAYDPQATCPRWRKFLDEIFNDNFELSDYIQRAVGYSLSGNVREHCLFLCYGTGRNGKSVFLNTIASMLGDYATGTPFSTFEMSRYQSQSTNDLAALRGKRFVSARETQEARRLNEARVKAVTGGDPITARFLYAEFFTYFPQFKFWLAVNHKPIIRDTSEGMWSRVRLIPFTVSFRGREDKKLEDTLRGELPGILGWALAGCRKWQELDGLAEPQVVIRATKEYKEESDPVGVFLAECTEPKPNFSATTDAKALYDFYVSWCEDAGEEPLSQTAFGRRLAEKGYEKIRTSNGRNAYRGIDVVGSKATTETE